MSVEEARETLRYLRDQAANHYETISNWLIIDLVDQALEELANETAAF